MTECVRTFRYRLYPSKKQVGLLEKQLLLACEVYNFLLEKKIGAYEEEKKNLSQYDLNNYLVDLKKQCPELCEVHSQVLQNTSHRVSKAFEAFFRRLKERKKAGFPRFKSAKRYKSITFPQAVGYSTGSVLRIPKIGEVAVRLHRPVKGTIKTITIKRTQSDKWFACIACVIEPNQQTPNMNKQIGIDMGIKCIVATSDGQLIENPRHLIKSEERLRRLQRRLSKKEKGSRNKNRARKTLARAHEKVANQRNDFYHKLSKKFVDNHSLIAVEKLNIKGMTKNHCLAKHIHDAGWNEFIQMLEYKAEETCVQVVKVPAQYTSIDCSACGARIPKTLDERIHKCECGLMLDRDVNAARNILLKGISDTEGLSEINACGDVTSTPSGASRVAEARNLRL